MKKITRASLLVIVFILFLSFVPIKQIHADGDPNDVGTCVIPVTGQSPTLFKDACTGWGGVFEPNSATCTVSNWSRQSCNDKVASGNKMGNQFTTVYPVTQLGWCTINGSTTGGWPYKNCVLDHPGAGVWSATDPTQTSTGSGSSTGTGATTGSGSGSGTGTTTTPTTGTCDYGPDGVTDPNSDSTQCTAANGAVGFTPTGSTTEQYFTSTTSSASTTLPGGLVPCDNVGTKCDFNALLAMINGVIHFILFFMVVPISAIMFAYAGFLLITAGGEAAGARTKAKNIFFNAVIGLIIAVACWLIISTVLHILGYDGSWIGLKV